MRRFLVVLSIAASASAFAEGGLPNQPYIYVEGKAETQRPADVAKLGFRVVGRAPELVKANADVQARAGKVFELLHNSKVSDNDIVAESIQSDPEFAAVENDPRDRDRTKIVGYTVTRRFDVKVRDIATFPKLIDDLMGLGAEFSDVDSELTKKDVVQDELWSKALSDARDHAEKTAKPMGVKIDSVFAVSSVPFPDIRTRMFGEETRGYTTAEAERVIVPSYKLAPVTLSQSVHVIYLVSPATK